MSDTRDGNSPTIPLALLAAIAAIAFGNRDAPFELTRPATPGVSSADEMPLWEDPLQRRTNCAWGAVLTRLFSDGGPEIPPCTTNCDTICVTLPSGDTPEASETRRRTRYAVHAAMTDHGYKSTDTNRLRHAAVPRLAHQVPFEDFVTDTAGVSDRPETKRATRVYWIDEKLFSCREGPVGKGLLQRIGEVSKDPRTIVIGPSTSAVFTAMQRDVEKTTQRVAEKTTCPLTVYSPWATQYEDDWRETGKQTREFGHVTITRTIPDDLFVARALVAELRQRGIPSDAVRADKALPGDALSAPSRVLLIIERDSPFARAWKAHLEEAWTAEFEEQWSGKQPRFEVAYFSGGLDGLRAGIDAASAASIETPEGRATLDYLRRLRAQLGSREIVAVGVFAQDVHDKLLVIQGLRPLMSEAIFFTNDLDAYFGHPRTAKYTRNLVVASPYALSPTHEFGNEPGHHVAPFRNQYQTATYEAVVRAIAQNQVVARSTIDGVHRKGESRAPAEAATTRGTTPIQLFEITTSGARKLTAIPAREGLGWLVTILVVITTILVVIRATQSRRVLPTFEGQPKLRSMLVIGFLLPPFLAAIATCSYGAMAWTDEPFEVVEGISVWPTEILRLLSYYLALLLGVGLLRTLRSDYAKFRSRFALPRGYWRLPLPFEKIGRGIDRIARSVLRRPIEGPQEPPRGVRLLGARLDKRLQTLVGLPRAEVDAGIALVAAVAFFTFVFTLMVVSGLPHTPTRGDLARVFDRGVMMISVVGMLWLLFLVAGTNIRMTLAIWRMPAPSIPKRSPRPPRFDRRDQDFVARARFLETIAGLGGGYIYGPFVVMLVLILSRWRGFDDWSWPPLLVGVVLFSVAVALTASFMLTAAARAYRRKTVQMIDQRIRDDVASTEKTRTDSLERLRREIVALDTGIFAGLSGHPAVRALLIPLSGVGGLSLLPLIT